MIAPVVGSGCCPAWTAQRAEAEARIVGHRMDSWGFEETTRSRNIGGAPALGEAARRFAALRTPD
jgi:hypothetical protein